MTEKITLRVEAGEHDRQECPLRLPLPAGAPAGPLVLVGSGGTAALPLQRVGDGLLVLLDRLQRGETRDYELHAGDAPERGVGLVELNGVIDLTVGHDAFTSYHYGAANVRPYFYPVLGPTGVPMTRSYPMVKDAPDESHDHPHHRSLYVAFGEVNGVDVWSEPPHPNTGRIVHLGWESMASGPVAAEFQERLQWVDGQGNPLLDERRQVTVYATRSVRLLDLGISLTPSHRAVLIGDTKEGGPLALRVNSAIEGRRGGLIENAYGGRTEAETWGKRAPWVDYSGEIDSTTVGIAIMDHPTSFRHPTYWHVRDYGLVAANPFGISAFVNDPSRRGDVVLVPGQWLTFRYRLCFHRGDARTARIADRYHDFANPPRAAWSS